MEIRVMVDSKKTAEALTSFIMSEAVREMLKNQDGEILAVLLPGDEADLEEGLATQEELTEEIIRNKLDQFDEFVHNQENLPEDFSDYNTEDWQIFALDYLRANFDDAMEGYFERQLINEQLELSNQIIDEIIKEEKE